MADHTSSALSAGFLGGGFMARVHSNAARSAQATLAGLASSSAASARRAAGSLGIATTFDDAEALLADAAIDVVHICTPNATHAPLAAAALDAGKHVVCEKPLAIDLDEARALSEKAAASGLVAAVPFVYRFHPMVREARARIAAGDIGRVLSVRGGYLQDWMLDPTDDNWRVDPAVGGASRAFADIGSHLVDLVEFITGDRIARLSAVTSVVHPERGGRSVQTEDAAAVTVQTAGGAIGTLLVSQVAPGRKNQLRVEIAGTAESIDFDQEQPELLWIGRRSGSELRMREAESLTPDAARLSIVPAGHPMGYQDAFNAFVADTYAAIGGAEVEGLPTFADGLRAAEVTDAVLRSAHSGQWVELSA